VNGADLRTIKDTIKRRNVRWQAREHPIMRMPLQEQARRLGVIVDKARLTQVRRQPQPDIAVVVAISKGLRVPAAHARGRRPSAGLVEGAVLRAVRSHVQRLPKKVDWRRHVGRNRITPVKDQGGCGSCVSFGTTATLESMASIERNLTLDLSEAELLFCGGGSCGGWWPDQAVTYLLQKGTSNETCFPYQDHDMACQVCGQRDAQAVRIQHSAVITDVKQRKQYLAHVGPMMAVFDVYQDFFAYARGIYSHVSGNLAGSHCVEVIGYAEPTKGLPGSWICKNSWGSGWGDAGFFQIAYRQCGIDTTYPFWGISGTHIGP
jgi:C1A family cysteine protease